ncbi:MAG: alcohol dehydrogenase catalytic domain-containing protein [Clostridia bacterium]|nr:alcohol dehydrogenase catalytic domain-containing protein [Clostridia bacterium]
MRTARLIAPERIELIDTPLPPAPAAGEAMVKVKAVGICGTDMHIFKGERADVALPRVMGHELSGVVHQVGEGVTHLAPGDRVVFDPVMACGKCSVCRKGRPNVCAEVRCYGVQMDGAFRDYITVPANQLYVLPEGIELDHAALAEPFSIAANILSRADVQSGESVLVMGSGTIGLCLVQALKGIGARVLVSDVVAGKLETARSFGSDATVNSATEDLVAAAQTFAPDGLDVIIEAVGITPLTQQAILDLATPTARIVVLSFDNRPMQIPPVCITKKELSILGSRMNAGRFPLVLEWLEKRMIHPEKMISRVYPVEQIQQAFENALADSTLMKTLITFD